MFACFFMLDLVGLKPNLYGVKFKGTMLHCFKITIFANHRRSLEWMQRLWVFNVQTVLNDISNVDTCTTPTTASANSPAATSSSHTSSSIPSTPCRVSADCDVFTNKESFEEYLTEHPVCQFIMAALRSRCGRYIFALWILLLFIFLYFLT